jgi:ankyrin repeat protein
MSRVTHFGYFICAELFMSRRRRSRGEPEMSSVGNVLAMFVLREVFEQLTWMVLPPHKKLLYAIDFNRVRAVRRLVENGVDYNRVDKFGLTALMHASFRGRIDIVRVLIANGADVNHVNNYGEIALVHASWSGRVNVVRVLIELGADVNRVDKNGWTALMHASSEGRVNVVRALIELGADVNRADNFGKTALDIASAGGFVGVVRLLTIANARRRIDPNAASPALQELANLVHEHGQSMPDDVYVKLNASLQRAWRDTGR